MLPDMLLRGKGDKIDPDGIKYLLPVVVHPHPRRINRFIHLMQK
jgi:hypothetical protein